MNKKITNANVPVFILAGGKGTRLAEETHLRPKPMVEIGGIPILVHIMRHYYRYGFTDFVVCAGYKSWDIKQYFLTYNARINHLEIDHRSEDNLVTAALGRNADQENWRVRVVDTGVETMTGARIAQAFDLVAELDPFDNFAVTYGDGLSNHNLTDQLQFHVEHDCIGTVLGVQPLARFGQLDVRADGLVERFLEKPEASSATISGGFFFFKKSMRKYLELDAKCILERAPLEKLAKDSELKMFHHTGFWQPMDTLRDRDALLALWESGEAPWKPT